MLSRYLRAVRPPPQNSAKAKKLDVGLTARKSPIGSNNNQWGCPPLIKVSLYCNIKISILGIFHPIKKGMII
ncbi:hypothetical protein CDB3_02800 [Bacillus sp. CDB3]|nr:hypothetical protein CDB3_02800 [Bacillus sp. CDB3]